MRIGRTSGIWGGGGIERRAVARRVEPIAGSSRPTSDRDRDDGRSRALVPMQPAAPTESPSERLVRWHSHAPFLAQLIATRDDQPHTRRLRRAEPARAAGAYGDAMDGVGLLVPGYLVDTAL